MKFVVAVLVGQDSRVAWNHLALDIAAAGFVVFVVASRKSILVALVEKNSTGHIVLAVAARIDRDIQDSANVVETAIVAAAVDSVAVTSHHHHHHHHC